MKVIFHIFIIFTSSVLLHFGFWRLFKPSKFLSTSLVFSIVPVLLDFYINYMEQKSVQFLFLSDTWVEVFILLTMWQLFLTFFINLLNSVSLKMIAKMRMESGNKITFDQLIKLVEPKDSILSRYERMQANGLIKINNGDVKITKKGLFLAGFFEFLRRFFLIPIQQKANSERVEKKSG
jgi:hypothetical protein